MEHGCLLRRGLRTIRQSFRSNLARAFERLGPALAKAATRNGAQTAAGKPDRKRPRLTPQQRAALKLQGRYMGTMRGLKPAQRAKVKKVRAEKGIRAALAEAKRMAS